MKRSMKLPNGYGSVHKLPGNRRKPYRARKFVKNVYDEEKGYYVAKYATIGYYETKAKALQALAAFNETPYNLEWNNLTFKEVYELWVKEYQKKLSVNSSMRTITSAYKYTEPLWNMKFSSLKTSNLKECIENARILDNKGEIRVASVRTKGRIKSVFNMMYRYALENDIVSKNYAELFSVSDICTKEDERKILRKPFEDNEIKRLFELVEEEEIADMVLINIFSGWRPSELVSLKTKDVNIETGIMKGGMKTDSGRNREVPIHYAVKDLIIKRYKQAEKNGDEFLFTSAKRKDNPIMTYNKYRHRFSDLMRHTGFCHTPHDTRHTFITKAKMAKVDEYALKRIVGHSIKDITESVYAHRNSEFLISAMNQIPVYMNENAD